MSRRDKFHDAVKHALEKEGWTITHDPLPLRIGNLKLEVDLGAETGQTHLIFTMLTRQRFRPLFSFVANI